MESKRSKEKNKVFIEKAAERLAEIFCKQIEAKNKDNKKEYYENLINRWRESKNKIPLAQRITPGGKIEAIITIEYIEEREKIKKELDGCLNFLTDDQLEELFTDDYFMGRAMQILFDRKKYLK